MHREILQACLPCLVTLVIACLSLVLVARLSGARLKWSRLRRLHSCQDGGVQSLAFVLTLPLFVMIVLLILQISQLMVGMMVVNYAALAAARAASVWIPAQVDGELSFETDSQNRIRIVGYLEDGDTILVEPSLESPKYQQIRTAAVLA